MNFYLMAEWLYSSEERKKKNFFGKDAAHFAFNWQ
jgi:hypothetical protein